MAPNEKKLYDYNNLENMGWLSSLLKEIIFRASCRSPFVFYKVI